MAASQQIPTLPRSSLVEIMLMTQSSDVYMVSNQLSNYFPFKKNFVPVIACCVQTIPELGDLKRPFHVGHDLGLGIQEGFI